MKAHIIENNKVVNTIEVASLDFLPNLIDGSVGGIGWSYVNGQLIEHEATPEPIPTSITPRQIRLHLTAIGLRQAVEDYVASASLDIKDWWEFSLSYERNNELLISTATALGMTSEQLDQFFVEANKL
jgi:hypothetical protein